jgi:hypothetical protein
MNLKEWDVWFHPIQNKDHLANLESSREWRTICFRRNGRLRSEFAANFKCWVKAVCKSFAAENVNAAATFASNDATTVDDRAAASVQRT